MRNLHGANRHVSEAPFSPFIQTKMFNIREKIEIIDGMDGWIIACNTWDTTNISRNTPTLYQVFSVVLCSTHSGTSRRSTENCLLSLYPKRQQMSMSFYILGSLSCRDECQLRTVGIIITAQ